MEHGGPILADAGTVTVVPAGVPHRPVDGRDMDYWLVGFCATCVGLDESQVLMRPISPRPTRRAANCFDREIAAPAAAFALW